MFALVLSKHSITTIMITVIKQILILGHLNRQWFKIQRY